MKRRFSLFALLLALLLALSACSGQPSPQPQQPLTTLGSCRSCSPGIISSATSGTAMACRSRANSPRMSTSPWTLRAAMPPSPIYSNW